MSLSLSRSKKKLATVAVKTPMTPIPVSISATAMTRPSVLTGETSPYPTVVAVTIDHHSASPSDPIAGLASRSTAGCLYKRLAHDVERGIEQHRHAGKLFECLDQGVQPRLLVARNGLNTAGAVDVHNRRHPLPHDPFELGDFQHESHRRGRPPLEPSAVFTRKDHGGKRPEALTEFDTFVQQLLRTRAPRIAQDAAAARGSRLRMGR